MSTKIGQFEILSELAKSPTGTVYKANDPEGQTVALKAIELSAFGEGAAALEQALLQEAENSKALTSSNITPILGAGEMDGKFCAAMEYVQGNSIATMLARKEGFSIWDLLDIGRQVCGGLDYAHSNKVYHFSLEPAKIMCGWDGTVKILSYGVSSAGKFTKQISEGFPTFLHYMSPEQIRGDEIDGRSNLFSLGAMFYEMVTDRKAFDRPDAENLRQSILESSPVPPMHLNAKLHPLLSDLIMKALAKHPSQRYQRGRDLLDDLEKCKESKPQVAARPAASQGPVVPDKVKAAVQAKFVGSSKPQTAPPRQATPAASVRPAQPKAPAPTLVARKFTVSPAEAPPKAAAAAASWGGGEATSAPTPEFEASNEVVSPGADATIDASETGSAYMSAAPDVETFAPDAPKIKVDPMMAEDGPSGGGASFSDVSELPPLKDIYIEPVPPPPSRAESVKPAITTYLGGAEGEKKPKIQPREVAQKAIKEIKAVPPRMMLYSVGGAAALILIILVAMWFHYSSSTDDDSGAARATPPTPEETTQAAPRQPAAAPSQQPAPPSEAAATPAAVPGASEPAPEPAQVEEQPDAQPVATARSKGKNARRKVAPAIVPGMLTLDSTPQGAAVQIDGSSDSSWVTPLALSNLQPGSHSIVVSKAGYTTDSRTIDVASGSKSTLVVHLAQMAATLSVSSNPAGASIFVDGRDTGKMTPARVNLDKGTHVVLVRKMGYLDETTTAQFTLGQTVSISPTLRPMGNVDSIRTVGKMKRLFGGKGGEAGQGAISIHTQPKGAQVAINQRILDKNSPVDAMLDPGNYQIDITLSGYAPIHRVVTVDTGGKVVVDEVLQRQ